MTIRVLIADDHAIVTEGLQHLIAASADLELVGSAQHGREAVELAARTRPDVVVMDLSMPEMNGIEATNLIVERSPESRVLILSMHADAAHVVQALRAGAKGYILKRSAGRELVKAIRTVVSGRRYLPPELSEEVLDQLVDTRASDDPSSKLSSRERQVLQMLAEGCSVAAIAKSLSLSPKTVETYRARIMNKLEIHNFANLVRFAIQHGIASL